MSDLITRITDTPADVTSALFALYDAHGDTRYDAAVTQKEHALQSAALADRDGADTALIVAALLHDIGHLLVNEHAGHVDFLHGDKHHERVGAAILRRWFPAEVTEPIAMHVPAKRYLVATDTGYAATLSAASIRSLALQGGPMTEQQAHRFIARPFADAACRLRRWDDRAKAAGRSVPGFGQYRTAVQAMVVPQSHPRPSPPYPPTVTL